MKKIFKPLLSIMLGFVGFGMLAYYTSIYASIAVFLLMWGNNLSISCALESVNNKAMNRPFFDR